MRYSHCASDLETKLKMDHIARYDLVNKLQIDGAFILYTALTNKMLFMIIKYLRTNI